jgi:Na+/melibiose symporter-like transporter
LEIEEDTMGKRAKGLIGKMLLAAGVTGVIEILWTLYNVYVPLWLQTGNPNFIAKAGVVGFGLSATATGVIMTFDNIGALVISPVCGVLSDVTKSKWGRRMPWIVIATPIAVLAFMLMPFFVLRIPPELSGQSAALGPYLVPFFMALVAILIPLAMIKVPAESLLFDITPSEDRTLAGAFSSLIGSVTGIVASIIASMLFAVYAGLPFWVFGVVSLLIILLVFLFVKDPVLADTARVEKIGARLKGIFKDLKTLSKERVVSLVFIITASFFFYLSFSQLGSFLSSYAVKVLGMSMGSSGLLYAVGGGCFFIGTLPAGFIGKKIGRKKTSIIGALVMGAAALVIFLTSSQLVVWVSMCVLGFFSAFTMVCIEPMVVDSSPNDNTIGTLLSINMTMRTLSYIAGPILGGVLIEKINYDYRNMFIVMIAGAWFAALALLPVKKGEKREPTTE